MFHLQVHFRYPSVKIKILKLGIFQSSRVYQTKFPNIMFPEKKVTYLNGAGKFQPKKIHEFLRQMAFIFQFRSFRNSKYTMYTHRHTPRNKEHVPVKEAISKEKDRLPTAIVEGIFVSFRGNFVDSGFIPTSLFRRAPVCFCSNRSSLRLSIVMVKRSTKLLTRGARAEKSCQRSRVFSPGNHRHQATITTHRVGM